MGDPKGFLKYAREGPKRKPVELRVLDWKEMYEPIAEDKLKVQGARCMDCGGKKNSQKKRKRMSRGKRMKK